MNDTFVATLKRVIEESGFEVDSNAWAQHGDDFMPFDRKGEPLDDNELFIAQSAIEEAFGLELKEFSIIGSTTIADIRAMAALKNNMAA